MNIIQLSRIYGIGLGILALLGLFVSGRLLFIMNTDFAMDVVRLLIAASLLYVGFIKKEKHLATTVLLSVGVIFVVIGIMGFISPTLGGLLPRGLTGFDVAFHVLVGTLAMAAGSTHHQEHALPAH